MANESYTAREVTNSDVLELMGLKNSVPFTERIMDDLIRLKGWHRSIFQTVFELAPKCEHGGITVFYNQQRDCLLIPTEPNGQGELQIIEVNKKETHFHTLILSPPRRLQH